RAPRPRSGARRTSRAAVTPRAGTPSPRYAHSTWRTAMRDEITVVGGGLAGLVAAIHAAERGDPVTLHESHAALGGRGRATPGPRVVHDGAHVFYADGPHWRWLRRHGAVRGLGLPAPREIDIGFRTGGRLHRMPPGRFANMMFLHRARR